jgi:hypothetical protein
MLMLGAPIEWSRNPRSAYGDQITCWGRAHPIAKDPDPKVEVLRYSCGYLVLKVNDALVVAFPTDGTAVRCAV